MFDRLVVGELAVSAKESFITVASDQSLAEEIANSFNSLFDSQIPWSGHSESWSEFCQNLYPSSADTVY